MDNRKRFAAGTVGYLKLAALVLTSLGIAGATRAASSISYGYDQVGRVTTASYDNGLCVIYTYDANGNRTMQSYSTPSSSSSQNWGSGVWGCHLVWTP